MAGARWFGQEYRSTPADLVPIRTRDHREYDLKAWRQRVREVRVWYARDCELRRRDHGDGSPNGIAS